MKNKKGLIIFGSVGLVCVIVGVLLLVLVPGKSKKELYTEAISKSLGLRADKSASDEVSDAAAEITEMLSKHIYKVTINGDVNTGEAGHVEAESVIYIGKNQFYAQGSSMINDKTISGEALFKDDTLYFKLKDVLKKYYYIENVSQYVKDNGETKIVEKLINYLADSFKDAIEEEDVKVDTKELTINGKTYKTDSYGYTFTGNTLYSVLAKFVEKVKNDKDVLTELNKLLKNAEFVEQFGDMEISQSDLNSLLDQLLEACQSVKSLGNLFTYTVCTYKDDVISRQISISIPSEQGNVPVLIADYKVVEDGKLYYKAAVSVVGTDIANIEIKQTSDTKYAISISYMQQPLLTGEFVKDSNGMKLTLEGSEDLPTTISIELEINNDGTGSLEFELGEVKGNLEYEVKEVDEIPEVNVTDSEPYTEMSEEEIEKVRELFESIFPTKVYEIEDVSLIDYSEDYSA